MRETTHCEMPMYDVLPCSQHELTNGRQTRYADAARPSLAARSVSGVKRVASGGPIFFAFSTVLSYRTRVSTKLLRKADVDFRRLFRSLSATEFPRMQHSTIDERALPFHAAR